MTVHHSFVRRLQIGFGVLVATSLLSLAAVLASEQRLRSAMEGSENALWLLEGFQEVQIDLATARAAEREFLLEDLRAPNFFSTGTSPALESHAHALAQLDHLLSALAARTSSEDLPVVPIRDAVVSYREHFQELVSLYRERGSLYTGLLGDMRRASYAFQEQLENLSQHDQTRLRAELFELVRDQSDYLRDLDNRPRFLVSERIQVLHEEIGTLHEAQALPLRDPLESYERAWKRLVEIDERIGRSAGAGVRGALRRAQTIVVPLTVAAVERARATFDGTARSFERSATLAREVSAAAALLAVAVAIFLGLTLSRRLRQSLAAVLGAVEAYARGDRSARVGTLPRQDEFARLGTSFDHMAETLAEATDELEEINASLELAVKSDTTGLLERIRKLVAQRKPPTLPVSEEG